MELKKLSKKVYIEELKNGFKSLGYAKKLENVKKWITEQNLSFSTLESNDNFEIKKIRSKDIQYVNIKENTECTTESFIKSKLYSTIQNDVKYLIHVYNNSDGIPFSISLKAIKIRP
jgi:hypothetical protein